MKLSKPLSALTLIALALLLSAASTRPRPDLQPPKPEQNESLTKEQTSKAESDKATAKSTPTEGHPKASGLIGESTTEKKQNRADNLRPEASVAEWIMVGITSAYVIVAFFTLMAIKRQADIAERALTELERPWVIAIPKSVELGPLGDAFVMICEIAFRNCGRSPAWLIDGAVRMAKTERLREDPDYTGADQQFALAPLAPDNELGDEPRLFSLTKDNYEQWRAGSLKLFIFGYIHYRDVFGEVPHETRFCLTCAPPLGSRPKRLTFDGPPAYNRYT